MLALSVQILILSVLPLFLSVKAISRLPDKPEFSEMVILSITHDPDHDRLADMKLKISVRVTCGVVAYDL